MTPSQYRKERTQRGLTQAALAEALGISRETVTRREAGDPRNQISREAELAISALPRAKKK